jgi:hypothetical protein
MNEFAEVLLSLKKSPLRYRIIQRVRHWRLRLMRLWKYRHVEPPF